MKKNTKRTAIALGSVMMLFATTLRAQDQPWSFGAKIGIVTSWLTGLKDLTPKSVDGKDTNAETSSELFGGAGLTASYAFHENVGVGMEILYAGLGGSLDVSKKLPNEAKKEEKDANKPVKTKIYSHNIVVPVMLKWFPMGCDPEEGVLTVDIGAQLVMPLGGGIKKSKTSSSPAGDKDDTLETVAGFKQSKQINAYTVSGIAGVSYEFPESGLSLEGRYHYGFMNFFKSDDDSKTWRNENISAGKDKNVSNTYATIAVGYNFARLMID
jgi:Outer membrane protein beta-barrel domain